MMESLCGNHNYVFLLSEETENQENGQPTEGEDDAGEKSEDDAGEKSEDDAGGKYGEDDAEDGELNIMSYKEGYGC